MSARLLFVHALSPLHAGTGQGIGVIDLPIAREKATGLPYLPGSSVKGTLRDRCVERKDPSCTAVFGPDTEKAADHAGSAQFSDQRLLLLPIRSLAGTFAWVTSPFLLQRLRRDASNVQLGHPLPNTVPTPTSKQCSVAKPTDLLVGDKVILEDLDLPVDSGSPATAWATWLARMLFADEWVGLANGKEPAAGSWSDMLRRRLCIVHDDVMSFLMDTATEITARIKLKDDTKTVQKGGLWYEEALPAETVLAGLIVATPVRQTGLTDAQIHTVVSGLTDKPIQFGGNATVGRGICRLISV